MSVEEFPPNVNAWDELNLTIHHLEHLNLVLHCQSSANLSKDPNKDPSQVEFVFYQDSGDFKKLTQTKHAKDYRIECHAKPRHQFVEDLSR